MASDLTKYLGNKIARWLAGQAMPTAPTNLYMALFNGDPRASGTEVTTTVSSTGRKAITWSVPASNDVDNVLASSAAVSFGNSEGDTDITHTAVFDASSGGKMLSCKTVTGGTASVVTGQPVSFGAGDIKFTLGA